MRKKISIYSSNGFCSFFFLFDVESYRKAIEAWKMREMKNQQNLNDVDEDRSWEAAAMKQNFSPP